MMPYAFDDAGDPVFFQHIHGWVTDTELDELLTDLDRLVVRERPFAVVLDCRGLRVPELSQLRRLAGWFGDNFDAAARYHRGGACVIDTSLICGSVKTIMQLQRMPMPVHVVETLDEGLTWAYHKLGIRVPSTSAEHGSAVSLEPK